MKGMTLKHPFGWVPSSIPGRDYIMCSLSECGSNGRQEIFIRTTAESSTLMHPVGNIYLFCSERCRTEWIRRSTEHV
jgi:hypothetical protein